MKRKKINIAFHGTINFNHPASVSGVVTNTLEALTNKGYDFNIFCDSLVKEYQKDNGMKNISLYPYFDRFFNRKTKIYKWNKNFWISFKLANSYANIIHIHQKPEIVIGYYLLRNIKAPVIFHIHSHPDAWKGSRWERAFRKSDMVIAVSRFIEERLIEKFPFLKGKTKVLYNSINTEIFLSKEKNITLPQTENKFTVFFAGNIWIEKGFDVLLKTARQLQEKNIRFLIAGPFSPEENPLHRQFKKNTPENIEYLGRIKHDDLPEYYASSDITIVPSKWEEPFGMVVIESMACGTPVIGSRIGGITELIDNGENGLLVTPGSVDKLKDAIMWCKKHPQRLKKMSIEARKNSLRFSREVISEQIEKIYEGLLSR